MAKAWKKILSTKVYNCPRFEILEDKVTLPNGSMGTFFIQKARLGVLAVPFDGNKIYLVNSIWRKVWNLDSTTESPAKWICL